MKGVIWAIVILAIAIGILLESRYALIVDSPIVAKIDKLTGDVWIVNAGVWRKVLVSPSEKVPAGPEGHVKTEGQTR